MFRLEKFRIDRPWLPPGSWSAYVAATVLVGVALLVRLALGPLLHNLPVLTFYPAVIVATFLGGLGSGLFAVALATLATLGAWVFLLSADFSFRPSASGLALALSVLVLIALANVAIVSALQTALARLRSLSTAERARDAQELRRLADALHHAAFGVAIVDAKTNAIQFANPAYATLRGTTVEQLQGTHVLEAYGPAEWTRIQALFDEAHRSGHIAAESKYVRSDGSVLPVQIDITCVYDATGEASYRIGSVHDITERKRAEAMAAELHALDARLRQILDETPIGMILRTVDDARYVWVNATYCRMLDYTADELIGRTAPEFRHPGDGATPVLEARSADPEWDPIDRRFIAKSGRIVRVRARAVRLGPDAAGQDLVLGLAEDVTRQRQTEAALRQAQKMEAIGNLAGGIAHDFNNLLGVVIADLDMIDARLTDNAEVLALVTEATEAALRGADLTRNLLAFARRQPLQPTELAVNAVLDDITRMLERILREDVTITLDLAPALWPVIADRGMLESCIVNLASNARDAMPRGGVLRIATANRLIDANAPVVPLSVRVGEDVTPGEYVMIEVADTGAGMSQEVRCRVFEPFFTTKAPAQHSGLGLSMVAGFISQSGGYITLDSEPGSGTTLRLFLPRAGTAAAATAPVPTPARVADSAGATVLVVEDNAALRRVAVRLLIRLGYTVIEADSGEAALAQLAATRADVLFTDVVMPGGMNGFELAQRACVAQPDIKVLLTSGFPEQLADPAASGARWLNKPYRADDLALAVRETLRG